MSANLRTILGALAALILAVLIYFFFDYFRPVVTGENETEEPAAIADLSTSPSADEPEPQDAPSAQTESSTSQADQDQAQSNTAPATAPTSQASPETSSDQQTEQDAPVVAETTPVEPSPTPPQFDTSRVNPDGSYVIAGRAAPGSLVELMVDNQAIYETRADATGTFAMIGILDRAASTSMLSLRMSTSGGQVVTSDQTVIVTQREPEQPQVAELDEAVLATQAPDEPTQSAALPTSESEPEIGDAPAATAIAQGDTIASAQISATDETTKPAISTLATGTPTPDTTQISQEGDGTVTIASNDAPVEDQPSDTNALETPQADAAPDGDAQQTAAPATTNVIKSIANPGEAEIAASNEPQAPRVVLADADGVKVLQDGGAGPSVLEAIALDSISYDGSGDVTLAGRSTGSGFVRVYLNNAPIKTLEIASDRQWRAPLPEVDTGVYTLRIDEVDADGNVVSRLETPFKREEPEVLAAALEAAGAENPDVPVRVVTVQRGNTLWGISRERYGEGLMYVHVFEANKDRIRNPDLIYPGQVFTIPDNPTE